MSEQRLAEAEQFTEEQIAVTMDFLARLPELLLADDGLDLKSRFDQLCNSLLVRPQDVDALWEQARQRLYDQRLEECNQFNEREKGLSMTNLGSNERPTYQIMTPDERINRDPRGLSRVSLMSSGEVIIKQVPESQPALAVYEPIDPEGMASDLLEAARKTGEEE